MHNLPQKPTFDSMRLAPSHQFQLSRSVQKSGVPRTASKTPSPTRPIMATRPTHSSCVLLKNARMRGRPSRLAAPCRSSARRSNV